MARKAQTKTITTIVDENAGENVEAIAGVSDEMPGEVVIDETAEFLSQFGQGAKVIVYKIGRTGEKQYLATCEPAYFSEDWLQETYGEGRYILQVRVGAKYAGQRQLSIGPPAKTETSALPVAPLPAASDPASFQIQLLMQELAHQREMMMSLLNRPQEKTSMSELAEAMAVLKNLSAPPAPGSQIESLMGILKTGIEIGKTGSFEDKDDGIMGMIKSALPIVGDVVKALVPGAVAPANLAPMPPQAAPAQIEGVDSHSVELLRHGISYLKQKALKGSSPDLYLDFILDSLEDPQWGPLLKLAHGPYEEFAKLDGELMQAPYRAWFENLLGALREAFNTAGAAPAEEKTSGTITDIASKRAGGD